MYRLQYACMIWVIATSYTTCLYDVFEKYQKSVILGTYVHPNYDVQMNRHTTSVTYVAYVQNGILHDCVIDLNFCHVILLACMYVHYK